MRLIAGAMSGTSADGVDVAVTEIDGRGLAMRARLVAHYALPFGRALQERIQRIRGEGRTELSELAAMGREISLAYAEAVKCACDLAKLHPSSLDAVAAHGQTLYHAPPDTIQWLDPALIAGRTNCPVVSDFRRADCAAGGQGAPLVPFADYILFRHPTRNRVLLNIGGIANLTWLAAGGSIDDVIAFDTGPGNCISDWVCRTHTPTGPGYDVGGAGALKGGMSIPIVSRFLKSNFFRQPPPKSTDGPEMIRLFEAACEGERPSFEDALATAAAATVFSIVNAIHGITEGLPVECIVSGGGVLNAAIIRDLRSAPGIELTQMDQLSVPSAAKEALAFALLGAATLDGEPSNVPSATGASRRVVLGSVTPRP